MPDEAALIFFRFSLRSGALVVYADRNIGGSVDGSEASIGETDAKGEAGSSAGAFFMNRWAVREAERARSFSLA